MLEQVVETDLEPELEGCRAGYENCRRKAVEFLERLSDDQYSWAPGDDQWSVAQCYGHLLLVGEQYLPFITGAIDAGIGDDVRGSGPFRHGRFGEWFVKQAGPTSQRKFKAPRLFQPQHTLEREAAIERFGELQSEFTDRARRANGLNLGKVKLRSPATALFRLTLGQALRMMASHQMRHQLQAERVSHATAFPRH